MYRGLKAKERLWLKKFDKVFTGRASKKECNALGVCAKSRKELYRARANRRSDAFSKPARFSQMKELVTGIDPTEHIHEIVELRRSDPAKLPLYQDEGPEAPSPAKQYRRG